MAVSDWSTTASSNNAAPPDGAPEGMSPGQVNDVIRQVMADVRAFYDNTALKDTANTFTETQVVSHATDPIVRLTASGAAADEKHTLLRSGSTAFALSFSADSAPNTPVTTPIQIDRTGTVVDTINFQATSVQVNGVDISATDGTFTATFTGVSSSPNPTLSYRVRGGNCQVYMTTDSSFSAISNATSFTFTGLPAACQSAHNRFVPCRLFDNGVQILGAALVGASGTVTFYANATSTGDTAFTGSGVKGLAVGWMLSYPL